MKNKLKLNSLNKKLLVILLSLTIIPLLITMTVIYYAMEQGFSKLIDNQQEEIIHTVQTEFNRVSNDLLKLTSLYSTDENLILALESGNREELLQEVEKIYPRLQAEHALDVFEFGDSSGIVSFRGHNPSKYGDDKSEVAAIQSALTGQEISGFEFGSSGLAVRAFAPVIHNNVIIGTLQTGLNDGFLKELNEMLPNVVIDIYDEEGMVIVSSKEENIGSLIDETSILEVIKDGDSFYVNKEARIHAYLPMYDPTGSKMNGFIAINQDISVIHETRQQIIWIALLFSIVTLFIVVLVAVKFSKTLSKPIKQIAVIMGKFSKGDLTVEIEESNREDEVGRLTNAMQVMRQTLHHTIAQVANVSSSVARQSGGLAHSAVEVKTGSEQIAMTMQEIADGTERQAHSASVLSEAMGGFTTTAQDTNEKGNRIQASSREVLALTNEGHQLMASSEQQMMKVDDIVLDAVEKMAHLDKQTQEISKLVVVIQEVATQTNLLALNAAIEAVRAGENGKGFAVVADEVRKLAEQVSVSVADITEIVVDIQTESNIVMKSLQSGYKEVEQGTSHIKRTSHTFNEINNAMTGMALEIQIIAENLSGMSASSQELNHSIEEIAAISQESSAGIEETAATSQQASSSMEEVTGESEKLAKLAEELHMLVGQFKLDKNG